MRQEVNAATVAEEVGVQSIAATLSTSSGQDTVLEMLKTLSARLERLDIWRNCPYIGGHLALFFKLIFKHM